MASVLVRRNGALRLYNKGAAEMVLTRCTAMINAAGESVPMTEVRCAEACVLEVGRGARQAALHATCLSAWPDIPLPAIHLQAMREELLGTVTGMASTGLRTLCLAYTDFPEVRWPAGGTGACAGLCLRVRACCGQQLHEQGWDARVHLHSWASSSAG